MQKNKKVTLLFNANKGYDRKIIQGIAKYIRAGVKWQLFIEEDLITRLERLAKWQGDGIIADLDDPKIVDFVLSKNITTIGIGGSYQDVTLYPPNIPYIATNNDAIAKLAVEYFLNLGYQNLAFYGMPKSLNTKWALEREQSFLMWAKTLSHNKANVYHFKGNAIHSRSWALSQQKLAVWLGSLPKPVAILATTDMRARQILDACQTANIKIPDEVAVLGVDDDEIISDITGNILSTIIQGTEHMGFQAAAQLDRAMNGEKITPLISLVDPQGIAESASTDYLAVKDEVVKAAVIYIRENACKGIQAVHVLNHLNLSRANVENRFKRLLNSSIHQEINNVQLTQVKRLLQNTNLTLAEIAEKTGYKTSQYMMMVFKKHFNMTPSEYRKSSKLELFQH
ncbi:XylR family transcriptional regulator [Algibacillus agarilyticus]|uniref:XylR family transcriptional regulator n=1 Tax=Algibacillus agarilyticus TaxID=2234133 RepID=UPI000DD0EA4B|nr:DNA-binding transcriptional regulator [Algibacillus agarilyticus]